MKDITYKDLYLGFKLVPLSRREALCFVSTYDKPFLLSKVAAIFTIHDCNILEAEIDIRDGIVTDLYKIRMPQKYEPDRLEKMLFSFMQRMLKGETNTAGEIFRWEKKRGVIQDRIVPKFKGVSGSRCTLIVRTSNKRGLLYKISWALSLAGMDIEKAIIAATEDRKAENVFWIRQRHGETITAGDQKKILALLKIIVNEGKDPIEQGFRKELTMIYRQQLRRRGSGFRTAHLYADLHRRLVTDLFERTKLELDVQNDPLLIGVYGGIGSGAIGFTSDIDCIFLFDGERKEEHDKLKAIVRNEIERISGLEVDESFLPYHINFFFLGNHDGESIISFDDFFAYINYIDEMRNRSDSRLFEPQFFHFPWAFSIRFIGSEAVLYGFKNKAQRRLLRDRKRGYPSMKAYILGEKREEIKGDYLAYLKGKYFPHELGFFDAAGLERLYRKRAYEEFIDSILPYESIKYVFRRGVFPLLHILHKNGHRTDMGLLKREYRHVRPAMDFMLKAFNVRKTLLIMGQWDLSYFLYIMNFKDAMGFCNAYLRHQEEIIDFVRGLTQ